MAEKHMVNIEFNGVQLGQWEAYNFRWDTFTLQDGTVLKTPKCTVIAGGKELTLTQDTMNYAGIWRPEPGTQIPAEWEALPAWQEWVADIPKPRVRTDEEVQAQTELFAALDRIEPKIRNQEAWDNWVAKNLDDGYGQAVIRYCRNWARLMEKLLEDGFDIAYAAQETRNEADYEGISGFQFGKAVQVLSECWIHGEALRQWHNQRYGYDGEGVVNPAVTNIE